MADCPLVEEYELDVNKISGNGESTKASDLENEKQLPQDHTSICGKVFGFPYASPYQIQIDFMKNLFTTIEQKKLGIFESPTGTGKSLSLLCGSLTWLQNREAQRYKELRNAIAQFDEKKEEKVCNEAKNWVQAQLEFRKRRNLIYKAKRELKFLEELQEKRKIVRQITIASRRSKAFGLNSGKSSSTDVDKKNEAMENTDFANDDDILFNDEFAPEFIDSDDDEELNENDENENEFYPLRVIFASRTHSQLSQCASELKKTVFSKQISTVTLGSRQNLCIHPEVTSLKNLSLMNERCLDLQKKSKGQKTSEGKKQKNCSGCPFFNQTEIEKLKRQILSEVLDIEELVSTAKTSIKGCPYYASRKAAKEAQLILLPYNTILHKGTREGTGLKLNKDSVLLLDEAHNIIESISNMYSTQVSRAQLSECLNGLKIYIKRYMSRFNAKNLLHYKQLTFVVKSLISYLDKGEDDQRVMTIREFKNQAGIEALDFYEMVKFTTKSKIIFKLRGYLNLQSQQVDSSTNCTKVEQRPKSSSQSIIYFIEFLKSIVFVGSQGKIIHDRKSLKFLLLNTFDHFAPLVTGTRSVVLAGGTMKPYEDVEDQLFGPVKDRITHFSCDHVIPDDNLKCIALSHGPSGTLFDFTFKNRSSKQLLEELSRIICNISKIVPGGLVVFFPSYDYENSFYLHLKESSFLEKIEIRKKIFREPRDVNCEKVLADYGRQIRNCSTGATLFAVVGGKLSEGINFADDLGRCVIVVGLPYPNITSIDIKEKVNFVSETFGPEKAKQLLPNACFKAVNQSIGRSIRHSNDYASIILLDQRFLRGDSQKQLPGWISSKYVACNNFGQCISLLANFFISKKVQK